VKGIGLEDGKNSLCTACLDGEYPTEYGKILAEKARADFESGASAGTIQKRAYE